MADIAREFGIANGTVRTYLDSRGIEVREKGISEELHQEIIDRYANHERITHIASQLGSSTKSVRNVLQDNGVIIGTLIERYGTSIKERYESGETAMSIDSSYKRTESAILNALKEMGVERRSNSEAHGGMRHKLDDEVKKLYIDNSMDMRSIGRRFGVSKTSSFNR